MLGWTMGHPVHSHAVRDLRESETAAKLCYDRDSLVEAMMAVSDSDHHSRVWLEMKITANKSVEPTGARHSSCDVTGNRAFFLFGESHSLAPVAHFYR